MFPMFARLHESVKSSVRALLDVLIISLHLMVNGPQSEMSLETLVKLVLSFYDKSLKCLENFNMTVFRSQVSDSSSTSSSHPVVTV